MRRVPTAALCLLLAALSTQAQTAGKKYALLIGVTSYDNKHLLPPLRYTENDVEKLAEVLKGKAGFEVSDRSGYVQVDEISPLTGQRVRRTRFVDREGFNDQNLQKADYEGNPLLDGSLDRFQVFQVDVTKLTSAALTDLGLSARSVFRCRNFFCLGMTSWLYHRPVEPAEQWIRDALARGERLMGFGHAVYRTEDPRSRLLHDTARDLGSARLELAETVEREAVELLRERYPERDLRANVELYTALVLEAVGLPRELFVPVFATSRVVGWTAHVREQAAANALIRPGARYVGPALVA